MSENEVKEISKIEDKKNEKKKCFIITPIGNDDSDIRRHIEGIIDEAIVPAIGDKYEIEVAHRRYEIGSINDKVIRSIYESDLVIANLTNLNPNVMFELAIRYSFGKPVIVIAEKATNLPFDIIDENTIFYINDPRGANDLKESIKKFEKNIDYNNHNYGPVFKAISKIPLYRAIESGENVSDQKLMTYVIERLNTIERGLKINQKNMNVHRFRSTIHVSFATERLEDRSAFIKSINYILKPYDKYLTMRSIQLKQNGFSVDFNSQLEDEDALMIITEIEDTLEKFDIFDHYVKEVMV